MTLLLRSFVALLAFCLSGAVWGQAPSVSNYEKLKELDKWVGTWEVTGEAFDGTPYVAAAHLEVGTQQELPDGHLHSQGGWQGPRDRQNHDWLGCRRHSRSRAGNSGMTRKASLLWETAEESPEAVPFTTERNIRLRGSWFGKNDDSQSYTAKIKKGDSEPGTWTISLTRKKPAVAESDRHSSRKRSPR